MVRSLFVFQLAVLFGSSSLFAQAQSTRDPEVGTAANVDKDGLTEDVRFRNELSQRMTVSVLLSGAGPYRFLVDTGANRTTISRQLATQLNLRDGGNAALHSVAGASVTATAIVPSLELTRKPVKTIQAPVLETANMGADGILGTDALASKRVVFDFASQTMSIVPSSKFANRDDPGTIVVEGRRRNGRLVVTGAMSKGRELTVVVDTGSEVTVGNPALRTALQNGGLLGEVQPAELMSVTGEKVMGELMYLRELEIGGVKLQHLAIIFAPVHTFGQLSIGDKPALLLGMNAMRAFKKVSIDFASQTLRVIVPESSSLEVRFAETHNDRADIGR